MTTSRNSLSLWSRLAACVVLLFIGLIAIRLVAQDPAAPPRFRVLVFSKTAGYRHASIPNGIEAIHQLGADHRFAVDATEDAAVFTDDNLARYEVVVFLSTTADVLDRPREEAFERFIRKGGGFAGVHSASDTEYDWPWFGQLVGAWFEKHPKIQEARIIPEDPKDRSTEFLPNPWVRTDEWYNFRTNPRERVRVLARLDESTYQGGTMGADHPISWRHEFDGGRSWYTALGHTKESYTEPLFLRHLLGGIEWAANTAP
jgi:type 1 glutamine amidotransferase